MNDDFVSQWQDIFKDNVERIEKVFHLFNNDQRSTIVKEAGERNCKVVVSFLLCESNFDYSDLEDIVRHSMWEWKSIEKIRILIDDDFVNTKLDLLRHSIEIGNLEVLKYIVNKKMVDLEKVDSEIGTALCFAVYVGNLEIVKFLVETESLRVDVNKPNSQLETPLYISIKREYVKIFDYLIQQPNIDIDFRSHIGETVLWLCCYRGYSKGVKKLLEMGANRHKTENIFNRTPLFISATQQENLEVLNLMLEKVEEDLNFQDSEGTTPLMMASCRGYLEVVKALVEKGGADLNLQNNDGETALMISIYREKFDVMKYLISKKANLNLKNNEGKTALGLVSYLDLETQKYLSEIGAE